MKPIFKTGTFLTANNLNLAQKASGLSGIIEGCSVVESSENFLLSIEPGLVKLDSGIIVIFDGSELIDTSDLPNDKYFVCLVEYSEHSIDYGIFKFEPTEYPHVILATVVKSGNSFTITNGVKASTVYLSQYLQFPYIREYIPDNILSETDSEGIKYLKLQSVNTGGASSGDFSVSFIANSALKTIRVRCTMASPNRIEFKLMINGDSSDIRSLGIAEYYDVDKRKGFLLNVDSGLVNENDSCTLIMSLFNQSASTAEANLYEIILN